MNTRDLYFITGAIKVCESLENEIQFDLWAEDDIEYNNRVLINARHNTLYSFTCRVAITKERFEASTQEEIVRFVREGIEKCFLTDVFKI